MSYVPYIIFVAAAYLAYEGACLIWLTRNRERLEMEYKRDNPPRTPMKYWP